MIDQLDKLYGGMFSDELDCMGYRSQVISGWKLNNSANRCLGPARTILIETRETPDENIHTGLGFLEQMEHGEILCVSGSSEFAYFGELMSRLSIRQGIPGAIIDGLTRDSLFTRNLQNLAVFAQGYSPKDIKGRGRVQSTDVEITIQGVTISPGDWIYGDSDGVVVIPQAAQKELFERVSAVIDDEQDIVDRIDRGESISTILNFHKAF